MRPRSSILDLFDPLASQEPSRDTPSPDSDKENCLHSDFSFFGRPPKAPSPVRLKRRLVDVGDITIDDPTIHPMLTEEDELDDSMCDDDDTLTLQLPTTTPVRDMTVQKATPSNVGLRTPLAELPIDRDIIPIARTKIYRRSPPSGLPSSDIVTPASSESSSFASVIDAVTTSGVSFAGPARSSPDYELENDIRSTKDISYDNETPQITVTPIDEPSNSVSTFSLDTPLLRQDTSQPSTSSLSESSETSISIEHPRATLRPSPPKTSSQDKKRHSIDLYTSFHLQLQSEEASFDLLNDKISLFASTNSMDSFLNGLEEDDSFDMAAEEAKLQATIDSIKLEEGERKADEICDTQAQKQEYMPSVDIPSRSSSPHVPSTEHMEQPALRSPSLLRSTPGPLVPSEPTKEGNDERLKIPRQAAGEPSVLPSAPLHDRGCAVFRTPAPNVREQTLPPPVPALRIVKRSARPGHEKSASTSSTASVASERPVLPIAIAHASVPSIPFPITQHVSSTDINRVAHVRSAASEPSTILPPIRTSNGTDNGPRRVPIVDSQPLAINKRRGVVDQKIMPQGNTTGPRRVIVNPSVPVPAPVPAPAPSKTSGLKAPTRYGVGTSAVVSALPRPVSRLPTAATSGNARPLRAGPNVVGTGMSQGNVKRATYARRVV